ncbi:D-alpha,beta-D-heptose 1,7-bisphosphate phosphatase [Desulfocurvibacter africanus PCS]|uniref:D,D-heptose 1,7-bisphosphate phosphatase n=1 Tax=Desulfocurvibacter africanus PCS TaxID=1262666 RepID=M5PQ37_DESAF|nr:HAD family hydrolase [Desulfocurvibacter africanus]EMG36085.1 D-alpha,beta-D-heptose 1,7-bisphosphate phosphatase [Desulfocurvibacter africanus PCS]
MTKRYVVLDRDGTIIVDKHYLADPDGVELLPGAVEGLARLAGAGLGLIVVTNQSGIGRGYFGEADMHRVNARLSEILAEHGVRIERYYFCPHGPDADCTCRKPCTGLLDQAAQELGLDPKLAFVIGDKVSDIELGRRTGAVSILVRTGKGAACEAKAGADYTVDDLAAAAEVILKLL